MVLLSAPPPPLNLRFHHMLLLLVLFSISLHTPASATSPHIPYSPHCSDVVSEPPQTLTQAPISLTLNNAYFSGGKQSVSSHNLEPAKGLSFHTQNAYKTHNDDVFKIDGKLSLRGFSNFTRRELRLVYYRPPRIPARGVMRSFLLSGLWNSTSGKLCMVGSGSNFGKLSSVHVVLKLNYPNSSSIFDSLVNGTLESLNLDDNSVLFDPISILGVALKNYEYKLIDKKVEEGQFRAYDRYTNVSLRLDSGRDLCSAIKYAGVFELERGYVCDSTNCSVRSMWCSGTTPPSVVSFDEIECSEDGSVRYLLVFGDRGYNGIQLPFLPEATVVAEGKWNVEKRRLDMVGCRIQDGRVVDCSIRLKMRLPGRWSMRDRSAIAGEIWTDQSGTRGCTAALHSRRNTRESYKDMIYEYTEVEKARGYCEKKMILKGRGGKYPDGLSSDMKFSMRVKDQKGNLVWGSAYPLNVGNKFYRETGEFTGAVDSTGLLKSNSRNDIANISYVLNLISPYGLKRNNGYPLTDYSDIAAEGLYDHSRGHLCMISCMHVAQPNYTSQGKSLLDCDTIVDIQFAPLDSNQRITGTIESTRGKSDPLYFQPLEILSHSIYTTQAKESLWRMDLEMTMVLISNTLACIFVGLQLFHTRRNQNTPPFISVFMLVILTLEHMIPLLLNFEAVFVKSRNKQNVYLGTDGWLEVNEVLVRVITMIAFLLQSRLLQLAWSARAVIGGHENLWASEKKTLYTSLPLYLGGGLIAWLVHLSLKPFHSRFQGRRWHPLNDRFGNFGHQQQSLWGDLKSYAGLILDGFLLPQILFNLFCDTKMKALAAPFYVGNTFVRLLPHIYDLYRTHSSTWSPDYIYANPRMDFYSTPWDIIICIGGLLFVFVIYLQQQFGGRCFLPKRFRKSSDYEKVSTVTNE